MKKLNIDEVMALQMYGMPTHEIIRTDLDAFDALYDEVPEMEAYVEKANSILDKQEAIGIFSHSCHDERFPKRLLQIGNDCPAVIHCLGDMSLLDEEKAVAIIGARSADNEGNAAAYELGKRYAKDGYVVVSGLALGCDTSAHRGCLAEGGRTIAIVGSGLDITHPRENKPLQDAILQSGGLLISEQVMGVKANPTRLVARNRLQAAMSQAVILAQCPAQSGSLHTMRFARKYNRESLAVAFAHRSEANAGNFALIDQGLALSHKL